MNYFPSTVRLSETSKKLYNTKIAQWVSFLPSKNIAVLIRNPEKSMEELQKQTSVKQTNTNFHIYISAIVSYLKHVRSPFLGEEEQNDLLEKWQKLQSKNWQPRAEHYSESKPTELQADKATVTWDELVEARDKLPIGSERLLLGFYTHLDPLRADYFATEIVSPDEKPTADNYIVLPPTLKDPAKLVVKDFKTKKRYEKLEQVLPPVLHKELLEDLKTRPRKYLFTKPETPTVPFDRRLFSNWACRTLSRVLGKPMTLTAIRHLFISRIDFNKPLKELERTAHRMGHSTDMQRRYAWREDEADTSAAGAAGTGISAGAGGGASASAS